MVAIEVLAMDVCRRKTKRAHCEQLRFSEPRRANLLKKKKKNAEVCPPPAFNLRVSKVMSCGLIRNIIARLKGRDSEKWAELTMDMFND